MFFLLFFKRLKLLVPFFKSSKKIFSHHENSVPGLNPLAAFHGDSSFARLNFRSQLSAGPSIWMLIDRFIFLVWRKYSCITTRRSINIKMKLYSLLELESLF